MAPLYQFYPDCIAKRCPNGRDLKYTTEIASEKSIAKSYESKDIFTLEGSNPWQKMDYFQPKIGC
jgi:hypothetical protein